MVKLVDANVILRYLLGDHPDMSESARQIINLGAFTVPEVIAEVVYVLKEVYQVERKEIGETLTDFLDEIEIDNKEVMKEALYLFGDTSLDFVDCILIARHRILKEEIASFDKKLNRMLE